MNDQSLYPQDNVTPPSAQPAPAKNRRLLALPVILAYIILLAVIGLQLSNNKRQQTALEQSNSEVSDLETKIKQTRAELSDIKESTGEENIDKDAYQAVFFKGGQVYFGKITTMTASQITLEKIYYLQMPNADKPNLDNLPQDAKLIKLGNEIHKPQDAMFIERKEVEFWENLKNDGEVAKGITEFEKSNPN